MAPYFINVDVQLYKSRVTVKGKKYTNIPTYWLRYLLSLNKWYCGS